MNWISRFIPQRMQPVGMSLSPALPAVESAVSPVYFVSHGGPTFMYSDREKEIMGGDIGAFHMTRSIGKTIVNDIKPKFIICVSAHWLSSADDLIEVGIPKNLKQDPENDLFYDFYGFPKYMYEETFRTKNDLGLAQDVVNEINHSNSNLKAKLTKRGLDHGVWVPLKVAFPNDELLKLNIPLLQVSLTRNEMDFDSMFKLGQILSTYRSRGGLVITSGMSVHNLHDMRRPSGPTDYTPKFTQVLNDILLPTQHNKMDKFRELLTDPQSRSLLLKAHPTVEHFVPMIVALGAAEPFEDDLKVKELYNNCRESLGWGIYQFGDLL